MVQWFRRRSRRSRVIGSVVALAAGLSVAVLLDVLKDALLPDDPPAALTVLSYALGAATGLAVDRVVGQLVDARWGARSSAASTRTDARTHFEPRGRGVMNAAQPGHRFTGRRAALAVIMSWLLDADAKPLLVVTGDPGSGKSAVLGRVVSTSHPAFRRRLPRWDAGWKAPVRSIGCEVHAKGLTATDVATEIAHDLGASGTTTPEELPIVLAGQLGGGKRRFVVVLDALDEAVDPRGLISQVLRPLLDAAPSGVRLLVGTRRRDDLGPLPSALHSERVEIDLDAPEFFDRGDVRTYALACLQARGPAGAYADRARARVVADAIARQAGHSFLVVGLVASEHGLYDATPVPPARLRTVTTLAEALDGYLGRLGDIEGVSARDVLLPLAYAHAPGLPISLWCDLIHALTGRTVLVPALDAFACSSAANLLVTTGSSGSGEAVFRLFHQALNETLLEHRRHSTTQTREDDEAALVDVLLAALPRNGWAQAPAYLARALAPHLISAGMPAEIEALLKGTDYLLYADLPRLYAALGGIASPSIAAYRQLIGNAPHLIDLDAAGRAAALSVTDPDGERWPALLAADLELPYRGKWAVLRREKALVQTFVGHRGPVNAVAVTPDGKHVLSGGEDGTVRVWELASGIQIADLAGHADAVNALAVTPDGRHAVSGSDDGTARVWDLETGLQTALFTGHSRTVSVVDITPDGRRAVTGGYDHAVRVWDLATGAETAVLVDLRDWVTALAVMPDGEAAVVGCHDGSVGLWDLVTGTRVHQLGKHSRPIKAVAVTPDGNRAVVSSLTGEDSLVMWDLRTGTRTGDLKNTWVVAIAITPDGTRAVTGGTYLEVLDVDTGNPIEEHTNRLVGSADTIALTPDGRYVVTGGDRDGTVRVWDAIGDGSHADPIHGYTRGALAVTPDGREVVTGHDVLHFWDVETGTHRREGAWPISEEQTTALAPGGRHAMVSNDHTAHLLDVSTGTRLHELTGHSSPADALSVTPDGGHALSLHDGNVHVWDLTTGTHVHQLPGDAVLAAAVCDNRQAITCGSDGRVVLWDLSTGNLSAELQGRIGPVSALAAAPDGTHALIGERSSAIRVWDPATSSLLHEINGLAAAVTPDGSHAIVYDGDGTVRHWDLTTATPIRELSTTLDTTTQLSISPDGRHAAIHHRDATTVWGLDPAGRVHQFPVATRPAGFAMNGTYAFAHDEDELIHLWNLATGTTVRTLDEGDWSVQAVVTPDGLLAYVGSRSTPTGVWNLATGVRSTELPGNLDTIAPDGGHAVIRDRENETVALWDLTTGNPVRDLTKHLESVYDVYVVAVTPDRSHALTGERDGTVRLWDLTTGAPPRRLEHDGDAVAVAAIAPDRDRVVVADDLGTIRIWDLTTGRSSELTGNTGNVVSVAITGDSRRVVTNSIVGTVRVWDMTTRTPVRRLSGQDDPVSGLALTPDGRHAVTGDALGMVRLWDLSSTTELRRLGERIRPVQAVTIAPDGKFALISDGYRVLSWDLGTGAKTGELASGPGNAEAVCLTPDGRYAIVADDTGLRLWDARTGRLLHTLNNHSSLLDLVAITSDGRLAITVDFDGALLWDIPGRRRIRQLTRRYPHGISTATLSQDGTLAVTGNDDGTVRIWNLATEAMLHEFSSDEDSVHVVAVTPDNRRVIVGGMRGIRVWDPNSRSLVHFLPEDDGWVTAVATSADGTLALSGSSTGAVRVWDLTTGTHLHDLTGHTTKVSAVLLAGDSTHALTAAEDGTVRTWRLPLDPEHAALDTVIHLGSPVNDIARHDNLLVAALNIGIVALTITLP